MSKELEKLKKKREQAAANPIYAGSLDFLGLAPDTDTPEDSQPEPDVQASPAAKTPHQTSQHKALESAPDLKESQTDTGVDEKADNLVPEDSSPNLVTDEFAPSIEALSEPAPDEKQAESLEHGQDNYFKLTRQNFVSHRVFSVILDKSEWFEKNAITVQQMAEMFNIKYPVFRYALSDLMRRGLINATKNKLDNRLSIYTVAEPYVPQFREVYPKGCPSTKKDFELYHKKRLQQEAERLFK